MRMLHMFFELKGLESIKPPWLHPSPTSSGCVVATAVYLFASQPFAGTDAVLTWGKGWGGGGVQLLTHAADLHKPKASCLPLLLTQSYPASDEVLQRCPD